MLDEEMNEKRGMVKMLLDMLKHSASDEVGHSLPDHAKGLQVEKVSVLPHEEGDMEHVPMAEGGLPPEMEPEKGELTHIPDGSEADGSADEEAVRNLPGPIEDEGKERDEKQALHDADMMDEDEDSNQSAFQAFLPRKNKKR